MAPKPPQAFVAYYRLSRLRKGDPGYGIDAQREAVRGHVQRSGGALVGEYTEYESGSRDDRPELAAAIADAKARKATLVIGKLDRLSRHATFLLGLSDSKVKFVAADMPDATDLTVGILAVVAQNEREAISRRTREGLAAAKRRGVVLGRVSNLTAAGRKKSGKIAAQRARERYRLTAPLVRAWSEAGLSLNAIAAKLNDLGAELARGKGKWTATQVGRVLKYSQS